MKNFRVSPISMQKYSEIASGDNFRSKILEGTPFPSLTNVNNGGELDEVPAERLEDYMPG